VEATSVLEAPAKAIPSRRTKPVGEAAVVAAADKPARPRRAAAKTDEVPS
jgi:hypothetical protein